MLVPSSRVYACTSTFALYFLNNYTFMLFLFMFCLLLVSLTVDFWEQPDGTVPSRASHL